MDFFHRTQQIVEKEMARKKEEEENLKILQERDEALRKQIEIEEERLREKELQMRVCIKSNIIKRYRRSISLKSLIYTFVSFLYFHPL